MLWIVGFCFLLSVLCFVFRAPLLCGIATAWIVNDPPAKADAIVVLGGGLEYRPFEAARLYTNGCAKTILITQPELSPTTHLGLTVSESVIARQVLLKLGVPETAIQILGTNVTSTRDEALALRAWLATHHASRIIIPTDIFHTRRAKWIFERALVPPVIRSASGEGGSLPRPPTPDSSMPAFQRVSVSVAAVAPPRYARTNWWQHEDGLIAFQNEVVKWLYYRLRY